jgi:signal transduction histidine kinase
MLGRLLQVVDWFIPHELRTDTAVFWRARIFAISHLLGPCSAIVILSYLYQADPHPGLPFWTIAVLCFAFWLLPFAMKLTKQLTSVAAFSIVDLTFVSVLGSYYYGGVSSPFLPWFLIALFLGFFYLGDRPFAVLGVFVVHLLGFCISYGVNGSFPELVPVGELSRVAVISVCAATLYMSMMAVYYANVIMAGSQLRREIERHIVTAVKMRQVKDEADRANEAKAVFLAKMSHQLRTPLNAIIGYSEILLEDGEMTEDGQMADVKMINSAGRHLLSLVSHVLDMPKIETDEVEVSIHAVELKSVLDEVAATCRSLVAVNGNELVIDVPDTLGYIESDDTRLRQIVINLLSNAGKFTNKGKVTIRARRESHPSGDEIIITVGDTGIGISPEIVDRLFVAFNQASAQTSREYGGTGLGLAVCRNLCQRLNGSIDVESKDGEGSTFTVRLPAGGAAASLPVAA